MFKILSYAALFVVAVANGFGHELGKEAAKKVIAFFHTNDDQK